MLVLGVLLVAVGLGWILNTYTTSDNNPIKVILLRHKWHLYLAMVVAALGITLIIKSY